MFYIGKRLCGGNGGWVDTSFGTLSHHIHLFLELSHDGITGLWGVHSPIAELAIEFSANF